MNFGRGEMALDQRFGVRDPATGSKGFRIRLSSALDEVDLDSHSSKALKLVLRRRGLL